jgi:hypothetical protein
MRSILAIAASTALIISGPAYAQHGHGGGKPITSPSTTHGNSGATTHGQSGSHGPATKPTGGGATHGPSAPHGKSGETHGAGSASTKKSSTTTDTATGSTTTLTPVQQKLQKNTNLADKLKSRLPENTDLMKAAEGFSNLGQFVAAVNVSNNLGLKFTDLRTRMVDDDMSLGQAIQDVKKTANVETEVKRAETEADAMIKSSTTSTTSSTTSTSSPTTTKKSSKTKTKSHSGEDK